ncbi:hypothetical protein M422DRAFT_248039 [Sphaerobolus stellatus SS14]|nr:hypothetical protein M422DRAFT_248039 [Sphaerobolus stellatus SS14]
MSQNYGVAASKMLNHLLVYKFLMRTNIQHRESAYLMRLTGRAVMKLDNVLKFSSKNDAHWRTGSGSPSHPCCSSLSLGRYNTDETEYSFFSKPYSPGQSLHQPALVHSAHEPRQRLCHRLRQPDLQPILHNLPSCATYGRGGTNESQCTSFLDAASTTVIAKLDNSSSSQPHQFWDVVADV